MLSVYLDTFINNFNKTIMLVLDILFQYQNDKNNYENFNKCRQN